MRRAKEIHTGLTDAEVLKQRALHGSNALPRKRPTPFWRLFLKNLGDPIIRILIAALIINFLFLGQTFDIFETLGILFAILSASVISALSERGGERAFDALWQESAHTEVRAIRGGKLIRLPIEALVVGDVVSITAGEGIPADGVLLQGELRLDQSALNGESREVRRCVSGGKACTEIYDAWTPDNEGVLLRGAVAVGGEGMMRVLRVGADTLYGGMIAELGLDTRQSPLHARLSHLAIQMSRVGGFAAVLVSLAYLFHTFYIDAGGTWAGARMLFADGAFVGHALLHALTLATTTMVMAVPEGLPMMISVVLAKNMKRMQKDKVLVKKPAGMEAAGSMNLLFCDKTGTLTEGKMRVSSIVIADGSAHESISSLIQHAPTVAAVLAKTAYYNTQAVIPMGAREPVGGNATERAILSFARAARLKTPKILRVGEREPFDSAKKYSSAVLDGVCYLKGAPEVLMPTCKLAISADGTPMPMPHAAAQRTLSTLTGEGMRVLCLCTEERGVRTFAAFLTLWDGVRADAPSAVEELRAAGVRVVMITGDNRETAMGVARTCGILTDGGLVLTSDEMAAYSDEKLQAALPRLCVVARALPSDKSRLVRLAQSTDAVIGMTGDGVNDAPALRSADVGFSMGSGTEAAKAASDIVIADDSLSSIAKAVLYGRTVFKNIRKFIMFQMTTNLSAVAISVICPLLGIESPITVLQMLWINMIMDTLGSLAFAAEPPLKAYMRERPMPRSMAIMDRYMVWRIAAMCLWLPTLCVSFLTSERLREYFSYYEEPTHFLGAFFALFVFADICNSFSARTMRPNPFAGLWRNRTFIAIFALIIAVQCCIIEFGGAVFRTHPLSAKELLLVLFFAVLTLPVSAVVKLALRSQSKR